GKRDPASIDADALGRYLDAPDIPDPDLIIRTSGEQRLSNFLMWQAAYSELVFVPIHWPDFDKAALESAIAEYARRERRFGGLAGATRVTVPGVAALAVAGICCAIGRLDAALIVLAVGFVAVVSIAPERRSWAAAGFLYAAAAEIASVLVRLDPAKGFAALMFVLLIVWVTDSGGYFAGRGIGGPKLWPRVSPKKTWAGAAGGFVASLAVAAGVAAFDLGKIGPLLMLSGALSVVSQLGDLFESAVKRRFGVKD